MNDPKDAFNNTSKPVWGCVLEAAEWGETEEIKDLLKRGADIDERDNLDQTPLMLAIMHFKTKAALLLIDSGASLSVTEVWGYTPLIIAGMLDRRIDILRALLDKKVPVDEKDHIGRTAFMWAAKNGSAQNMRLLLDHGAALDERDRQDGYTALILAAMEGHVDAVQLLIKEGASLDIEDNKGHTALYWAEKNNHPEIATILKEAPENRRQLAEKKTQEAADTEASKHAIASRRQEALKEKARQHKPKTGP